MKKDLFIGAAAIATGAVALTVSLLVNNGALNGLGKHSSQSQTAASAQAEQEPAYSPSIYWQKKRQETTQLAYPIIGMTLDEAEAFCDDNGLTLRVLGDGPITMDLRVTRVNVTLVDNVVDHFNVG
jgi:hypothetical protein